MGFPLKDWIDAHDDARHNLARSGMRGMLETASRVVGGRLPPPDPVALRSELARYLGVDRRRVFLTHGATEANALALFYLRRHRSVRGAATVRYAAPEYPPLGAAARFAGYRPTSGTADVTILSSPNNPTGRGVAVGELRARLGGARWAVVDETFREFRSRRSLAASFRSRVFTTGTFTKAWASDAIRLGFLTVPSSETANFAEFHGIVADELALASIAAARALLAARARVLGEARAIFAENRAALAAALPEAAGLDAPVWFDRLDGRVDGDRFARALLRRGVLVCPGRFFGDRNGVRICLTQRSFPEDLRAYLGERRRWVR